MARIRLPKCKLNRPPDFFYSLMVSLSFDFLGRDRVIIGDESLHGKIDTNVISNVANVINFEQQLPISTINVVVNIVR